MYLGKQSAGIWGMKCVKKWHFSLLTRGFSSFRELLKKRGVEPPIFYVQFRPSNVWFVGYRRGPTQLNMVQSYPQPSFSLMLHKNPKLSKSIRSKTQPVHTVMHSHYDRGILCCVLTHTSCFLENPISAHVLNYSCTLELKSRSCIWTEQRIALRTTQKNVSTHF